MNQELIMSIIEKSVVSGMALWLMKIVSEKLSEISERIGELNGRISELCVSMQYTFRGDRTE